VTRPARTDRAALAAINAVLPRVADHGVQVTYDLRHWVHPPWRVLLRSRPPTHWLDVHMGRLVLRAEWVDGAELIIRYVRPGDWLDQFLEALA
jgi:hypothetical protein